MIRLHDHGPYTVRVILGYTLPGVTAIDGAGPSGDDLSRLAADAGKGPITILRAMTP